MTKYRVYIDQESSEDRVHSIIAEFEEKFEALVFIGEVIAHCKNTTCTIREVIVND